MMFLQSFGTILNEALSKNPQKFLVQRPEDV